MHHHENVSVRFSTYTTKRVTKCRNKQRPPTTDLGIYRRMVVDTSDDQASVYFPGDDTNFTLCGSQNVYTLHPPVISVPDNILGNQHLLIPQDDTCLPLRDNPPPPLRGTLLRSSPMGYLYRLSDFPHTLGSEDLKTWGCHKAARLLSDSPPDTTWIYLDGSAGQGSFGSAATIFKPDGEVLVLCLPSPYHSSEGAEYWAAFMPLRWLTSLHSPMQCVILRDNDQVIRTTDAQPDTMASRSSHGTLIKAFCSLVAHLPSRIQTHFAWITGHAGFKGNECSDLFPKWIAYSSFSSPEFLPPSPIGIVSNGVLPVCHRLTRSISRSLIPRHCHHSIHVISSFHYYSHSSWFSGLPFKWSSGNMNFSTYAYQDDPTPRACHKCSHPHPLDVISFLSHCLCADHIISSFIYAWPAPFNRIASVSWSSGTHLGDKRRFAKMLVPSSLYEAMTTPTHGESKPQRVLAFKNALPRRQRKLKDALSDTLMWLAEDPPPRPQPPPQGPNTREKPNSTYSTLHTVPESPAP